MQGVSLKNKVFSLHTIRDYILDYFPNLLWWDGYSKHEPFNETKSYKHRQGMPNEIRIEFDDKDTNQNFIHANFTCINLINEGLSFAVFYVEGGRSPHIHIYDLDELESLSYEQRTKYRNKFLTKVCPKGSNPDRGLCDEKHLCALEFVNHFKYYNPKSLLFYHWQGRNISIDLDIKLEVLFNNKKEKPKEKKIQKKLGDLVLGKPRDVIIANCDFEKVFDVYKISYKGKMALCPFHNDTNYSLSFSNDKGLWKCFGSGCEVKGDIITLVKMLEEKNGKS